MSSLRAPLCAVAVGSLGVVNARAMCVSAATDTRSKAHRATIEVVPRKDARTADGGALAR
jgi:uncharacterized protein YdiU (UPF0061 family)